LRPPRLASINSLAPHHPTPYKMMMLGPLRPVQVDSSHEKKNCLNTRTSDNRNFGIRRRNKPVVTEKSFVVAV
jgi:hypothetical protein